jgi:hypothetical protein
MIIYIRKKFLKFEKAPPILKRTPRHFLWAVPSFGEENTESAKIVWPMGHGYIHLPPSYSPQTHPSPWLFRLQETFGAFCVFFVVFAKTWDIPINKHAVRHSKRLFWGFDYADIIAGGQKN